MFFDDPLPKKANLKPYLRLAQGLRDHDVPPHLATRVPESARERLLQARHDKIVTPSILDRIDAISRAQLEDQHRRDAVQTLREDQDTGVQQASQHQAPSEYQEEYQSVDAASAERGTRQNNRPIVKNPIAGEPLWFDEQSSVAPLIDPAFVIDAIAKWRNAIAATTILGGALGLAIALSTPKLYSSSAAILIDPRNYKVVENDINPDVFLSEAALAIVDSQLNIIRSPAIVDKVVAQLGLEKDSEFNGTKEGLLSPISGFFEILTGGRTEGSATAAAINNLNMKTDADRQPGTFIVTISATSEDAQKAALIANTIVDVYMADRAIDRSSTVERTTSAMQARLPELKKQVEIAEIKAATFKAENDLFDAQGRLIDDEEILRLNDQLSGARSATIALNARAETAKIVTVDGLLAGGLPEEVTSTTLASLRGQFTTAKQKFDGLQAKLGPSHPDLIQAGQEAASLKGSIEAEIKRVRTSLQIELRRAVQTEQSLAARLAQLKVKLAQSGDASVKLREIQREATSARTVYEQFLLRAQETSEQGTIDAANIRQTNFAKPSQISVGASRKLIVIGGLMAGLILGVGLAVFKGIFDALKMQYGGASGQTNTPRPSGPAGSPLKKSRHSIRGTFASVTGKNSGARAPEDAIYAQRAALAPVAVQTLPQAVAPQAASLYDQPSAAPAYPPHQQHMFAPPHMYPPHMYPLQMHPNWYAEPSMMMPPAMMPPAMMPQVLGYPHAWPQPMLYPNHMANQIAAQTQSSNPTQIQQQTPAPAPPLAAPLAAVPLEQSAVTRQNANLDDIHHTLAEMKAEIIHLARQRRYG